VRGDPIACFYQYRLLSEIAGEVPKKTTEETAMSKAKLHAAQACAIGILVCVAAANSAGAQAPTPSAVPSAPRTPMANGFPPGTPLLEFDQASLPRILTTDLLATDVEKSAKFYEDVFGMKVFMRRGSASFQSVFLAFPSADGKVLKSGAIRIMKDANFVHAQTLPDLVIVASDLKILNDRAAKAGYPATRSSESYSFFKDPSGNIIEVPILGEVVKQMGPAFQK
jgi:catechol 2,3-dioxygenase-like lactoylglutathione lyase family enzyme